MADLVEQIQFAFPYSGLEPLVNKLTQNSTVPKPATASNPPSVQKWNRNLDDVPLTLTAQWPTLRIATRKVLDLKPGDVLDLQPDGSDKIELRIGKAAKFKGRLGSRDGKWAIQINTVCKQ